MTTVVSPLAGIKMTCAAEVVATHRMSNSVIFFSRLLMEFIFKGEG